MSIGVIYQFRSYHSSESVINFQLDGSWYICKSEWTNHTPMYSQPVAQSHMMPMSKSDWNSTKLYIRLEHSNPIIMSSSIPNDIPYSEMRGVF